MVVEAVGRDILEAQETKDYQKASDILRIKLKETLAAKRARAKKEAQVQVQIVAHGQVQAQSQDLDPVPGSSKSN